MGTKYWFSLAKVFYGIKKIKILTLLPSSLMKNEISSLFSDITMYMIEKAINLAQEKGVYSEPEVYTGHSIDERLVLTYM